LAVSDAMSLEKVQHEQRYASIYTRMVVSVT